eukprot:scaffold56229_cov59-Phaeocystis_antarctica.AAC.4
MANRPVLETRRRAWDACEAARDALRGHLLKQHGHPVHPVLVRGRHEAQCDSEQRRRGRLGGRPSQVHRQHGAAVAPQARVARAARRPILELIAEGRCWPETRVLRGLPETGVEVWPQLQQVAASLLAGRGADGSRSDVAAEQLPLDPTDRVVVRHHRGERLRPAAPAARVGVRPRDALAPEADEVEQWRRHHLAGPSANTCNEGGGGIDGTSKR